MNWDEIKDSLADVIAFLIKCLPVIFVIGYIIFYIAVFVEYKDVPMTEVPAWVAWMPLPEPYKEEGEKDEQTL